MNVLDLFSGIGGFSLGLERAGMRTVAFCETEPFCRKILTKNFPGVPIYEDVRNLTAERLAADGIAVDLICGGFPCQDISLAGSRIGIEGERSGLWSEYARIIGEVRPQYVIVENVAALLGRGLDKVLGDLAEIGFDAEWHCIPASAVGAPHKRDRVWIVSHDGRLRRGLQSIGQSQREGAPNAAHDGQKGTVANPKSIGRRTGRPWRFTGLPERVCNTASALADPDCEPMVGIAIAWPERNPWDAEPEVGRVVDGLPAWMVEAELRSLGNAVVPQIPEIIGRAIMQSALKARE